MFATDERGIISIFIMSLSGTSYMFGAFILVLQLKGINSSQFVEMIKVKTTSMSHDEDNQVKSKSLIWISKYDMVVRNKND